MPKYLVFPPGGPRKLFNSKRGPQPKKFGNHCPGLFTPSTGFQSPWQG